MSLYEGARSSSVCRALISAGVRGVYVGTEAAVVDSFEFAARGDAVEVTARKAVKAIERRELILSLFELYDLFCYNVLIQPDVFHDQAGSTAAQLLIVFFSCYLT